MVCTNLILITLMFTPQGNANELGDAAVGVWLLDEGSGNSTKDSSGNDNHGTLMALTNAKPKWVKGKYGRALEFDGQSTLVNCGRGRSLNLRDAPMTVVAWVKPDWNLTTPRNVFAGNNGFAMPIGDEPRALDFGKGGIDHVGSSDLIAADNNWHHVAAAYDVNDEVYFYIDGKADRGNPHAYSTRFDGGVTYYIGGTDRFNKFLGIIDEVAVFRTTLTAEDIRTIMKGLSGALAVSPTGKKAITWGNIKSSYMR
jgi:hypothetical protein